MKIAIVGAGSVGTTIAYASAIQGVADEIALYDLNGAKATAEILDLQHGLQFVPSVRVQGGDELETCRDADVGLWRTWMRCGTSRQNTSTMRS